MSIGFWENPYFEKDTCFFVNNADNILVFNPRLPAFICGLISFTGSDGRGSGSGCGWRFGGVLTRVPLPQGSYVGGGIGRPQLFFQLRPSRVSILQPLLGVFPFPELFLAAAAVAGHL